MPGKETSYVVGVEISTRLVGDPAMCVRRPWEVTNCPGLPGLRGAWDVELSV